VLVEVVRLEQTT
jgi:hypothetical protein